MNWFTELIAKIVTALLAFWAGERQRADDMSAHEAKGAADAEAETEEVIAEIADARSKVITGGDARTIADRLRGRKSGRGPNYSEEPPAG